MLPADAALRRLQEGNQRYLTCAGPRDAAALRERREQLTASQQPYAVVLGCADSRVPVEIVFDQSLGDLFVVRVAGNIVAPAILGSIEYAVDALGAQLIVVLGHSGCGAVTATMEWLQQGAGDLPGNLDAIVNSIKPALGQSATSLEEAIDTNVRYSMQRLLDDSEILKERSATDQLRIVGACYSMNTGEVRFLD